MDEQTILQAIMIGLLLAGGYLACLRMLGRRTAVRRAMPVVSVILLVLFGILAAILFYICSIFGTDLVLMAMLLLMAVLTLYGVVLYLAGDFRQMHWGALTIFILYLLAVVYITILSRNTGGDHRTSLLRMDVLLQAIQTRSMVPMRHILQNVALFIPIGFLLPFVDKNRLNELLYPVLFGLALSVMIESVQLYLNLGQADLTDILANVLGAALGYLLFRLVHRMGSSTEEEEE